MRKISILMGRIVCLLLVLCLAGCGEGTADSAAVQNEPAASTAEAAGETQMPEEPAGQEALEDSAEVETLEDLMGSTENGVYTNEYLGIGCKLPEDWTYYTEEEIAEQNSNVMELLSDLEIENVDLEQLEGRELIDMFALDAVSGSNVNVSLSKMSALEALALTATDIVEEAKESILAVYEGMELNEVGVETEMYQIFGKERPLLHITVPMEEGLNMYQTMLIIKKGLYYGTLTVTSVEEDDGDEMLSWFYSLD